MTPQQRGLMIPASMGLRCQVPDDLESFTVTASWGVYESVPAPEGAESRIRRYKRTPVEIPKRIMVADLDPSVTMEIPLRDKVVLRVDRHDDDERTGGWSRSRCATTGRRRGRSRSMPGCTRPSSP